MGFTSHLMGGLGNQMFQISHAQSQAWRYGTNACFRKKSETNMQGNDVTNYINNIFKKICFIDNIKNYRTIRETTFSFNNMDLTGLDLIEFYGYYQSSKNFLGYSDKIKELFYPTNEFEIKMFELFPQLNLEKTVSIHVRRGDYNTIGNISPILDKSYFDFCVSHFEGYHKFIFSDDKKWVNENFNYENQVIINNFSDYEELWLMSLCKNNIMSNSTFSWWGSYLNKNSNKRVLTPNIWFGPGGPKDFYDIYESNWEKIPVFYNNGQLSFFENKVLLK